MWAGSRDGKIRRMMHDDELLCGLPDYISVGGMLKATPATEGGERFCYFEASNEGVDQQNEVVAAKALADSAGYFLRYGNIDIDHFTLLGKPNPAKGYAGIPNYEHFEIGRPVDVRQRDGVTFVKAQIYSGSGPAVEKANDFWSSLVDVTPPKRWYPSVGGAVLEKAVEIDSKTQMRKAIIKRVRWNNIGVSKTPVNQHVGNCATMPLGAFAKAMGPGGLDLAKALEAGYGTDSATLSGGGALRRQSLDGAQYSRLREQVCAAIRDGRIHTPAADAISAFVATHFGLSLDEAAGFTERLMRDIHRDLKRKTK